MKYVLIIMTLSLMSCQILVGDPPTLDTNDSQEQTCAVGDAYYMQAEVSDEITTQEVQDISAEQIQ